MKYEETLKEIKSYSLVKSRKELLENRLEVFNMKVPVVTNKIEPWKKGSIYTVDINTILDDLEKCDKLLGELDAAMSILDDRQKKIVEFRIIDLLNWMDIAEEMNFSTRNGKLLFSTAVELIDIELKKIRGGYAA